MTKHNPDYSLGKIYTLVDKDVVVYVGSTTMALDARYTKDRHNHFAPNREIKLYENFPCTSRFELCSREEEIRQLLNPTLNQNRCTCGVDVSGLTSKERWKRYFEQHGAEHIRKKREQIQCDCGLIQSKRNLARHKKSPIHQKHMIHPFLFASLGRSAFLHAVVSVGRRSSFV
jgi:hypothetical protein